MDLIDPYGRTVRDLRISITDRCNFRCTYCMPAEGMKWLPRADVLSYEEMRRLAAVCVGHFGVDGIRITGGEPTMRAHLPVLIEKLAQLVVPEGASSPRAGRPIDLAITTNGATLRLIADELRDRRERERRYRLRAPDASVAPSAKPSAKPGDKIPERASPPPP